MLPLVKKHEFRIAAVLIWLIAACTGQGKGGWGVTYFNDKPVIQDPLTSLSWAFPSIKCGDSKDSCPAAWTNAINHAGYSPQTPPWTKAVPTSLAVEGLDYCGSYGTINGVSFTMPTLEQLQSVIQHGFAQNSAAIGADTSLYYATKTTVLASSGTWVKTIRISDGSIQTKYATSTMPIICVTK